MADYVPLYYRVYRLLLQHIREGEYDEHTPLPTEAEFAARFQVSRVTLRKALEILEADGLVVRQRGRGTFARRPTERNRRTSFGGLIENIAHFQARTSTTLLRFERMPLPADAALQLQSSTGAEGLCIVRIRRDATSPFSFTTCYVPEPEAGLLDRDTLGNTPVSTALERAGAMATQAEQWLSAAPAELEVAEALDVASGTALISLTRVYRNAEGRPIELLNELYRPDRYEYRVNLSRTDQGDAPRWSQVES
ncbi:GntR family transcriptional regulator [Verticiella sediminum]